MKKRRHRRRAAKHTARAGDGLDVSWPWYTPSCYLLLALYLAGVGVAAVVLVAVRDGAVVADARRPALVAALGWVAVTTWAVLAAFVNCTTVRLTGGYLTVTRGPVYWPGNRRFKAADIEDVTVVEEVDGTGDGDPVVTYRVRVWVAGTYPRTLVAGLDDRAEADSLRAKVLAAVRRGDTPG